MAAGKAIADDINESREDYDDEVNEGPERAKDWQHGGDYYFNSEDHVDYAVEEITV